MKKLSLLAGISLFSCVTLSFAANQTQKTFTNSLGMKLIRVEPGPFMMGWEGRTHEGQAVKSTSAGWYRGEPKAPALWEGIRPGLVGAVFNSRDPGDRYFEKTIDQVNFDWSSPQAKKDKLENKSARWRGLIKAPATGIVTFTVETNDKVRIVINHEVVLDGEGKNRTYTFGVQMVEDQLTPIAIDTEQTVYSRLYWGWPGQRKVLVPAEAFRHTAGDTNMVRAYISWVPDRRRGQFKVGHGDYDEYPRHKVTITEAFCMGETEVTIDQFRQFQAEYPGYDKHRPYASAISWHDAAAFCKWLSEKEGKPYRLPTEAEWEYACRAGTQTLFSSGDNLPEHETANTWGLKNIHSGVAEWCLDWHGVYPAEPQVDPVGPEHGWVKIVRGGPLDWTVENNPYYRRSANRAAIAPSFGPPPLEYQFKQLQSAKLTFNLPKQILEEAHHEYKLGRFEDTNVTLSEARNTPFRYTGLRNRWSIRTSGFIAGRHEIGFRVVQAPMPKSCPTPTQRPFWQKCVKQSDCGIKQGPDPDKPYYRTRPLFPDFSGRSLPVAWKLGLEQGYGGGHHNSGLEVLPNGDMLAFYYNTIFAGERDACVSIMSMRFRHGANQWDMPSSWPDNVDCDDEGPVIWNDNGTLWLFWGSPRQYAGRPFQYVKSTDNGATWGPIQFPLFEKRVGPYAAQPINSAFRDSKGTVYVAVDGSHSPITSELFASRNNGRTWYDTGGRTYGRHSTFIILDNDVIMAFSGKQAQIDGFHPINISTDGGRTYEVTPSTLPALGGGTRASLIKLASGRLFYAADMHLRSYRKLSAEQAPPGFAGEGAYAALSDDNGQTWRVRRLVGGNVRGKGGKPVKVHTVSYVTARQSQDGLIHVITSHNHPDLHFTLNEAWVLQGDTESKAAGWKDRVSVRASTVKSYKEEYPDGKLKISWSAGIDEDGRYVLHGTETWFHENGSKQWEASYQAGEKTGAETYWDSTGRKQWQKVYSDHRTYDWTVWAPDGSIKAKSKWRGKKLLRHKIYSP